MADEVSQLIALLTQKEGVLAELLALLDEEQGYLLQSDTEGLEGVAERKKALYARVGESTGLCQQLMARLAGASGAVGGRNLSQLLPLVAEPERTTLKGLQSVILELGAALDKAAKRNGCLLQGALLTVNRSLEFFFRILKSGNTYGEAGRMVGAGSGPRLLHREA